MSVSLPEASNRALRLLEIARELASATADFQLIRGPGAGDQATNQFMKQLKQRAASEFSQDFSERKICGPNSFAVDFYFPEEQTVVEVALGLPNPACEYEKDVLKALMAQELEFAVRRLFFISRPGAAAKCDQPGRRAIKQWASTKHGLNIEVHELHGTPRPKRKRSRSPATPVDQSK